MPFEQGDASFSAGNAPAPSEAYVPHPPIKRKNFKNGKPMTLRMKIYETFEDPSYSILARWYSISLMLLIVLATACFVLESEATNPTGTLHTTNAIEVFNVIELVSVIIFTIEYVIRFACCPTDNYVPKQFKKYPNVYHALVFVFNVQNVIDLLACLPFWITSVLSLADPNSTGGGGLGFIRVIRLIRVFRVFKFGKFSTGIQMFTGAIAKSTQPLSILIFCIVLAMIILSSIMYMLEGHLSDPTPEMANNDSLRLLEVAGFDQMSHNYCFGTIPRIFWWSVITMTTVGYGDCYPVSLAGKIVAMLTTIFGVLILALPITVVGSNFQKMVEMYEEESGMLREFDTSEDGMMDEAELRAFLLAKRKDNALRKDVDLNPVRLMAKYDPQGNGTLSFQEFQNLKRDVVDPSAADPQANIRILLKRSADNGAAIQKLEEQLARIERMLGGGAGGGGGRGGCNGSSSPRAGRGDALPSIQNS